MVTVVNLRNHNEYVYSCSVEEAVVAAYAQYELHDWHTWEYKEKYSHLLKKHGRTVFVEDFAAVLPKGAP